jgi:uncharacterized protein YrrD
MLRSSKELLGYDVLAKDGEIGSVDDFYFGDHEWRFRYLIVRTGTWILGRKVLIPVQELGDPEWAQSRFPVSLTREQVKNSPEIDTRKPVSRQQEITLYAHYGWNPYWTMPPGGPGPMAPPSPTGVPPIKDPGRVQKQMQEQQALESSERHLRSVREVFGYNILAEGGSQDQNTGHLEDFIIDDDTWMIRYLVVDTGSWLPGRKVLVAPQWVKEIDFHDRRISIDLKQETIKNSPEYDPADPVNREYEQVLYDYYGRPKYWEM